MHSGEPRARYRPRGEAYLVVDRRGERVEWPLEREFVDLPPHWDARLARPPVKARVHRVHGGHVLQLAGKGSEIRVNGRPVEQSHVLRGGDQVEIADFFGVYTTARAELPWPMTLVVWPPEGPPIEIRSHRTRIAVGQSDGDVLVDDPTLDGLHCVIKRYRNGLMQIEDNGSYNGVWVDGSRIQDGASLRDGAEIYIGETRMKAWVDAPDVADLASDFPIQDAFDGLPDGGVDPSGAEPLRPYAVELGPDYVQGRRRTFEDDVPTRQERQREHVDVRPQQGHGKGRVDGYRYDLPSDDAVPEWAPLAKQERAAKHEARRSRGFQDAPTGVDWHRDDKGGLTLIHRIDRPVAPSKRKPSKSES